jgi:hypothetical protein
MEEVRQQYPTRCCDSALLSHHHTFGLHGGVGVVDCRSCQGYNVSGIEACLALTSVRHVSHPGMRGGRALEKEGMLCTHR